jgi:hypothetical protein
MEGVVYKYLSEDHDRLDALFQRAFVTPGVIGMEPYAEFRRGLLRHIAMEEKVMLPAIARSQGGKQAAVAGRLRLDHGAIAALMVPPPSASIAAALRSILLGHNALEEQDGGVYQLCEHLAGREAENLLKELKAVPEVPVMPHNARPEILEATRRALIRAGYDFTIGPDV